MISRRTVSTLAAGTLAMTAAILLAASTAASGQDPGPTPSPSPASSASPTPSVGASPTTTSSPTSSPTTPPGPPTQVLLAFTSPPPTDPARPCETGTTFSSSNAGDRITLVVYTYDDAGRRSASDSDGTHLTWRIEPVQPGGGTSVRFTSDPPTETLMQAGATNHAEIEDFGGDSLIVVELLSTAGELLDRAQVETRSHVPTEARDAETAIRARRVPGGLRGRLETETACRRDRQVTLEKRAPTWVVKGVVNRTGRGGRWHFRILRPGVYRVTAAATSLFEGNEFINCLPDRSARIRLRARHLRNG